jgi:hypothetical protein
MTNRILFATLALAASGLAPAQQQPEVERSRDVSFHLIDADADGRISRAEAAGNDTLGRTFQVADRDGDGFVDTLEYHQHIRELRDPRHQHPANPTRD